MDPVALFCVTVRLYLEADHQELNSFLHFGNLDCNKIWNRNLSIFRFSNIKADVSVVIEVVYLLIVDLVEGNVESTIRLFSCCVHNKLEGSREDAALFA